MGIALRRISTVVSAAMTLGMAVPAAAQNEAALKSYFEGRRVTPRIDMPGTSDGIDVQADASQAIDFPHYRDTLKRYGVAIHTGEPALVTLVKVKGDLIEFQLGGGGFGTFGDDTSTSVNLPPVEKSEREKELEKRVRDEDDRGRKREMERELNELRDRRERENRRIAVERERLQAVKRDEVAERRLRGGSRFNLRYRDSVPPGMRPEDVMAALAEYVDFNGVATQGTAALPVPPALPPPPAPPATLPPGNIAQLRKGLLRADVEREFGGAAEVSQRREGALTVVTLVFNTGEQRITAEFVEDVLIRYTITAR
ncbi:MAG: hypothetical protein LAO77_22250 [Acidobacteriia bacterium]|nr:hypothetical protein [Terriglobia bacterium]